MKRSSLALALAFLGGKWQAIQTLPVGQNTTREIVGQVTAPERLNS